MNYKNPHLIHLNYRPDIDGLRAIAIISVVLFHTFPRLLPGGFVGVDIFFVISGYLISSIIFSSLEHSRYSVIEFYIRRIRRIFPALIFAFITALAIGWFLLFQGEFSQLGKHAAAGAGFIENLALWHESGFYNNYFNSTTETNPFLHLWTLAIEEQFYIFWPLLLAFVWKRRWNFLAITSAIGFISFFTNIYLMHRSPTAAFYLPISRFWELMIGGVLSYLVLHNKKLIAPCKNWQSVFGLIFIAISLALINKNRNFPGWWALLPTVGTYFFISSGPDTWINRNILSNKFLVWIGLISYPLYLWHWILLAYLKIVFGTPALQLKIITMLISVLLSWFTYEYIEKLFRFKMAKKKSAFALSATMVAIAGAAISIWDGQITVRNSSPTIREIFSSEQDWTYPKGLKAVQGTPKGIYQINPNSKDITLFMGDSHIEQYAPRVVYTISKDPKQYNHVIFATYSSCPPIPNVFTGWDELHGIPHWANSQGCKRVKNYGFSLLKNPNVRTLVLGMSWDGEFGRISLKGVPLRYTNYYSIRDSKRYQFIGGNGVSVAIKNLNSFIKSLPKRIQVAIILDNPHSYNFTPTSLVSSVRLTGGAPDLNRTVKITKLHYKIEKELREMPSSKRIKFIDPSVMYCKNGICKTNLKLNTSIYAIYKDNNHLTAKFVRSHATFIDNLISKNSSRHVDTSSNEE